MSATFLKLVKPMLKNDVATLDTVDVWETRHFLTPAEAVEARAYWHETHPDPDAEPGPDTEPVTAP